LVVGIELGKCASAHFRALVRIKENPDFVRVSVVDTGIEKQSP